MYHWTDNNHFTAGFHTENSRADKSLYYSKVGLMSRKPESPPKEAKKAARLIWQRARIQNQDIVLCLSGGIDSEAMARAFILAEIPFRACVMRFNSNLNDFDIKSAIQFCEKNHIPYDIFDLDALAFFESGEYLNYGKKYRCQSPQLAAHLRLLDHIQGCPVMSWQAPEIFYKSKQSSLGLPGDLHCCLLRYFTANKRLGVPFFFLYRPELLASFMLSPFIQTLIWFGKRGAEVINHYDHKAMAYILSGFPVKPRMAPWTGFEKIKGHYDRMDKKSYGKGFNDRYRAPLEKLNPLPKKHFQIIGKDILYHPEEAEKLKSVYGRLEDEQDINSAFKSLMANFVQESVDKLQKTAPRGKKRV